MSRRFSSILLFAGCLFAATASAIPSASFAAHSASPAHAGTSHTPPTTTPQGNPLLPPAIAPEGFYPELSLTPKLPTITPQGFDPLYSAADWQAYRTRFGAQADDLPRKKSSAILEFANSLIAAAIPPVEAPATTAPATAPATTRAADDAHQPANLPSPGLQRLLLIRAAAISYRNSGGFATADKAVNAYQKIMDIHSAAQVGALWTISNVMSRMAVTPRDQRISYSAIAARANTQLALLLLQADQVDAAQSVIKLVGYHEGYLKADPALRTIIAQTRAAVRQSAAMMDYLATQYAPAIKNDDAALMAIYLYGRFVRNDPGCVADLPPRKPNSPMAQLDAALHAADHDPAAAFNAAETLRLVSATLPDDGGSLIKQRTLYAALERYRIFLNAPETVRERVKRTLALMNIESVLAEGARPALAIHPFDLPKPASQPATTRDHPLSLATAQL